MLNLFQHLLSNLTSSSESCSNEKCSLAFRADSLHRMRKKHRCREKNTRIKTSVEPYDSLTRRPLRPDIDQCCISESRQQSPLDIRKIPLGHVQSSDSIVLTDESGRNIPSSCIPLGNHDTQQSRWTLISTVLSAARNNSRQKITVRWGESVAADSSDSINLSFEGSKVAVENKFSTLVLSPRGIETLGAGSKIFHAEQWGPSIVPLDGTPLLPGEGEVTVLRDTPLYKKIRFTNQLADLLECHQEFDISYGSPFVRCSVRSINHSQLPPAD